MHSVSCSISSCSFFLPSLALFSGLSSLATSPVFVYWSISVSLYLLYGNYPPLTHCALASCRSVYMSLCFVCVAGGFWQGIDRSHSWVNSAYAPGGSRSVLRRNPNSSCELKQVQNPSYSTSSSSSPPPPPSWTILINFHQLAPVSFLKGHYLCLPPPCLSLCLPILPATPFLFINILWPSFTIHLLAIV